MQIIPVLDLKDNVLVHAKAGIRSAYQPINTPLCHSAYVFDVLEAFLSLYAFPIFYIADLDSIGHCGHHRKLINQITHQYPEILFWIDTGLQYEQLAGVPENHIPVIGSESQQKIPRSIESNHILSLDFKNNLPSGPAELFQQHPLWPENIILMTLSRVGKNQGPEFNIIEEYTTRYTEKNFITAGGIRNIKDIEQLTSLGVTQALVASALHSGNLTHEQIDKLFTQ